MTLENLKQITNDYFMVDIANKSRKAHLIKCRFLFYHTAYRLFPAETLSSLGRFLNQDHATVLHALKELPYIINYDTRFASLLDGYYKMIGLSDGDEQNIKVMDYDEIKQNKRKLIDLSAKLKIDELNKKLRNLRRVNKNLVSKIK